MRLPDSLALVPILSLDHSTINAPSRNVPRFRTGSEAPSLQVPKKSYYEPGSSPALVLAQSSMSELLPTRNPFRSLNNRAYSNNPYVNQQHLGTSYEGPLTNALDKSHHGDTRSLLQGSYLQMSFTKSKKSNKY